MMVFARNCAQPQSTPVAVTGFWYCCAGYNPDVKFMAHLWEPLNGGYRPLAFYLLVELVAYCSRQYLSYKGFQQHRHA